MTAVYRLFIGAVLALLFSALFPNEVHAQTPPPLNVALLVADSNEAALDVQQKLSDAGLTVAIIDVSAGPTPTLAQLRAYDAVLTWSSFTLNYADAASLGDVLAAYVDEGHGVVEAGLSFSPNTPARLDGAWRMGAYEPLSLSWLQMGFQNSLVHTQPMHPILKGVISFNGGNFSGHHESLPQGCSDVIAHWSNGWPLVAARRGPRGGRIIGLNFYPVSSSVNVQNWDATTDGGRLMANALRYAATPVAMPPSDGPVVALLAADEPAFAEDVRCKVQQTNLFSRVDTIDVSVTPSPTLASLAPYDGVLTWSNLPYGHPGEMGDLLADYVDQGGGVVQALASLDGRWNSERYRPLTDGSLAEESGLTLVQDSPSHAILSGVVSFSGGMRSSHLSPVSLQGATTLVASWSDGQPMIVEGAGPSGGRIVGLNLFPPSSDAMSEFWDRNTDGGRLIANALLFAAADSSNRPPVADAGTDQTGEASSAAGVSFTLNASATDPDGDPLTYTWLGAISATGPTVTVVAPPPAAPNKTQAYVVNLTVSDGNGGETTDSLTLTVTDYTGPVLHGVPSGIVTAQASSSSRVAVPFGPVTAMDAVDGSRPVTCLPSGMFEVGDTRVTCSSSDARGNPTSASFTVRVIETDASTPGKAFGYGFIRDSEHHYEFAFAAIEKPSGREEGGLLLTVKSEHRSRKINPRHDHFLAKTVDAVTFSQDSTVLFTGTGRWNGAAGYRYEVSAINKGKSNRGHRDAVRITIKAPGGAVVAHVDGILSGGEVQIWTH